MSANNLGDYLAKRQADLGLERADELAAIQEIVDGWYPGQIRVQSLNHGVLRLVVKNSVVASELRMRQMELLDTRPHIKRLAIQSG